MIQPRFLMCRPQHFAVSYSQSHPQIDEPADLPDSIALEGAGDCIWDQQRGHFWMGCGPRSDPSTIRLAPRGGRIWSDGW